MARPRSPTPSMRPRCQAGTLTTTRAAGTPSTELDESAAFRRAAAAGQPALVLRLAVIHGELLAGPDRPARIHFGARGRAAEEGVRVARVIDVAEAATGGPRIDGVPLELDDRDDAASLRA